MRNGYITKRDAPQGYVAVTRPLAQALYLQGVSVTVAGNKTHFWHVVGGWCIGDTIQKHDRPDYERDFNKFVQYYMQSLDSQLGTSPVFYVRTHDVTKFEKATL